MPSSLIIPDFDENSLGPAMKRCTERQRRFVAAILITGGGNNKRAAAMAGYSGDDNTLAVTGYRLAHTEYVQAAILEEAAKHLGSAAIQATATVIETMGDVKASRKERLQAAQMVMDRVGLHSKTEHAVNVTHDMGANATMLAKLRLQLQKNPDFINFVPAPIRALLDAPTKDKPIDAEFTEVILTPQVADNDPDADLLGA